MCHCSPSELIHGDSALQKHHFTFISDIPALAVVFNGCTFFLKNKTKPTFKLLPSLYFSRRFKIKAAVPPSSHFSFRADLEKKKSSPNYRDLAFFINWLF